MTKEEIKKLVLKQGSTITDLIDVVIEMNGFIGVGLITLGDGLKEYCYNKINSAGVATCIYRKENNRYFPHCIKSTGGFYWKFVIDESPRWNKCPHCGNEIERRD